MGHIARCNILYFSQVEPAARSFPSRKESSSLKYVPPSEIVRPSDLPVYYSYWIWNPISRAIMQYADVRSRGYTRHRHKLARELSIKSDFTAISPICAHRDPPYIQPTLTLPYLFFFTLASYRFRASSSWHYFNCSNKRIIYLARKKNNIQSKIKI